MTVHDYRIARERMVREQVFEKGISDRHVLRAMLDVPRHLFLDSELGPQAYSNFAFPIGFTQTMTQPYMVAYLAEHLALGGGETVLEIGTGSGYQAAVLSCLARNIFSIERISSLAAKAEAALRDLEIRNVRICVADGAIGWQDRAPFDRILLTAAAKEVPQGLLMQLRTGGFLLGPVVSESGKQEIVKLVRKRRTFEIERLTDCAFVPLVRGSDGPSSPTQPMSPNL